MSEEWVDRKIEELSRHEDPEMRSLAGELRAAVATGDLHSEVVVVENQEQNELTITSNLTNLRIDRVHIVKLDRVVE